MNVVAKNSFGSNAKAKNTEGKPDAHLWIICVLLCLLYPLSSRAGGLEIGDTGAEAIARGGAFVAKADNPTAINYNPAGFVKLRGYHVAFSLNATRNTSTFHRSLLNEDSDGTNPYPSVTNTEPWFFAPLHFMVTTDLGILDNCTLAGGFYAPPATVAKFPEQVDINGKSTGAPQRFSLVEAGGIIAFPSFAVAYRPTEWLDLGLSFQWVVTMLEITQVGTVDSACTNEEDPGCDVIASFEVQDLFTPSGSAGILIRPTSSLELGAMVRLPSKAKLSGKANISLGSSLKELENGLVVPMVTPLDPDITMTNDYPWMIRFGLRYIYREGEEEVADIEANMTWENWSAASKRTVTINAQSMGKPMDPMTIDWKLLDTVSVRLGGSFRLRLNPSIDLILRAGAFGETATTNVSDTHVGVLGPKRLGLTAGLGLHWGMVHADIGYAHFFLPSRVVNNSTNAALEFSGGTGPIVGNGTYSAMIDILSLQVTVSFGSPTSKKAGPVHRAVPMISKKNDISEPSKEQEEIDLNFVLEEKRSPRKKSRDNWRNDDSSETENYVNETFTRKRSHKIRKRNRRLSQRRRSRYKRRRMIRRSSKRKRRCIRRSRSGRCLKYRR